METHNRKPRCWPPPDAPAPDVSPSTAQRRLHLAPPLICKHSSPVGHMWWRLAGSSCPRTCHPEKPRPRLRHTLHGQREMCSWQTAQARAGACTAAQGQTACLIERRHRPAGVAEGVGAAPAKLSAAGRAEDARGCQQARAGCLQAARDGKLQVSLHRHPCPVSTQHSLQRTRLSHPWLHSVAESAAAWPEQRQCRQQLGCCLQGTQRSAAPTYMPGIMTGTQVSGMTDHQAVHHLRPDQVQLGQQLPLEGGQLRCVGRSLRRRVPARQRGACLRRTADSASPSSAQQAAPDLHCACTRWRAL